MAGFAKIFGTITDSSIWGESLETRVVWITMLAIADADGLVTGSVGGLARRANVSRDACVQALATLTGPDPDSSDGTTGERLQKVDRGWRIINHAHYRAKQSSKQSSAAARVARHRERTKSGKGGVTCNAGNGCNVTPASAYASASVSGSSGSDSVPEMNRRQAANEAAAKARAGDGSPPASVAELLAAAKAGR